MSQNGRTEENVPADDATKTAPNPQKTKSEAQGNPIGTRSFLFRLLLTAFSYFPHACCGMLLGSGGPAFLDLIQLTNSNVEEGSIFFTSQYLGVLIAGTVAGPLYDRFHIEPLMFVAICLTSGINIAVPYCNSSMWVMAVVNGLKGGTMGIMFTGCGLIVVRVWNKREGGPYMQALHFAYSIGGVIAPFIVRPFLAPRLYEIVVDNTAVNISETVSANITNPNTTVVEYFGETNVQTSFLIIGLITLSSALPFAFLLLKGFHITSKISETDGHQIEEKSPEHPTDKRLTIPVKVTFITFIVLYFIFIVGIETLFQNYTMTFVVEHLKWSKGEGTQISSAFWATFACGRFSGIFTAKLLSPWKILAVDFTFLSAGVVVLLIGAERSAAIVWVSVSLAGVFIGSLYASQVCYIQQRIFAITGKIYAMFLMASTSGGMVNPLILGTLIENYSPMWFVYLSVILCALCILDFTVLTVMVLRWGKRAYPEDDGILDKVVTRCANKLCGCCINSPKDSTK